MQLPLFERRCFPFEKDSVSIASGQCAEVGELLPFALIEAADCFPQVNLFFHRLVDVGSQRREVRVGRVFECRWFAGLSVPRNE